MKLSEKLEETATPTAPVRLLPQSWSTRIAESWHPTNVVELEKLAITRTDILTALGSKILSLQIPRTVEIGPPPDIELYSEACWRDYAAIFVMGAFNSLHDTLHKPPYLIFLANSLASIHEGPYLPKDLPNAVGKLLSQLPNETPRLLSERLERTSRPIDDSTVFWADFLLHATDGEKAVAFSEFIERNHQIHKPLVECFVSLDPVFASAYVTPFAKTQPAVFPEGNDAQLSWLRNEFSEHPATQSLLHLLLAEVLLALQAPVDTLLPPDSVLADPRPKHLRMVSGRAMRGFAVGMDPDCGSEQVHSSDNPSENFQFPVDYKSGPVLHAETNRFVEEVRLGQGSCLAQLHYYTHRTNRRGGFLLSDRALVVMERRIVGGQERFGEVNILVVPNGAITVEHEFTEDVTPLQIMLYCSLAWSQQTLLPSPLLGGDTAVNLGDPTLMDRYLAQDILRVYLERTSQAESVASPSGQSTSAGSPYVVSQTTTEMRFADDEEAYYAGSLAPDAMDL